MPPTSWRPGKVAPRAVLAGGGVRGRCTPRGHGRRRPCPREGLRWNEPCDPRLILHGRRSIRSDRWSLYRLPGELMAARQTLPVLPLRGTVIFPGLTAPIAAGRPGTLRAIESALKGDRLVFAVPQRD